MVYSNIITDLVLERQHQACAPRRRFRSCLCINCLVHRLQWYYEYILNFFLSNVYLANFPFNIVYTIIIKFMKVAYNLICGLK